jgi:hypothetical protein
MIEFTAVADPGQPSADVRLRLPQVLVPMLWWRGVPMRRAVPMAMTPLERFTLELAITMGRAEPEDFTEITGLPAQLLPIAARRLLRTGALVATGRGYQPVPAAAAKAANSRQVIEERPVRLDLVLLPGTGDMLALNPRTSWLRAAHQMRLTSVGNAPVPVDLRARPLDDYVAERLVQGGIAGAGADLTGVGTLDGEAPVISPDGWCPVYRGEGALHTDDGQLVPHLMLTGQRGDPLDISLPGADGLTSRWVQVTDVLADPSERTRAWYALTGRRDHTAPQAERLDLHRWQCLIDGAEALRLAADGRNLSGPLGLTVTDTDVVAELSVGLVAADATAEAVIGLDRTLTAAAEPGADPATVPPGAAVRDRAWQLGFYDLVYTLRSEEDFAYG